MRAPLNLNTPDRESDVTRYGKHNRLIVFYDPKTGGIEIREDLDGLPLSTESQRQKVAKGWQRLHPRGTRLVYVWSEEWDNGERITHYYRVTRAMKGER